MKALMIGTMAALVAVPLLAAEPAETPGEGAAPAEKAEISREWKECIDPRDRSVYHAGHELGDISRNDDFILGGRRLGANEPSSLTRIRGQSSQINNSRVLFIHHDVCPNPAPAEAEEGEEAEDTEDTASAE